MVTFVCQATGLSVWRESQSGIDRVEGMCVKGEMGRVEGDSG